LHFFIYGFPNLNYILNTWICVPKALSNSNFKRLFDPCVGRNNNNTRIVEEILSRGVYALTRAQHTAEWFLFRGFHITATLAGRILNATSNIEDGRMI
jgi:hypothetical protein